MQSEHPLFRRFEHQVVVGELLEWTTRGADLWARPLGGALDVVWCWPGQYNVGVRGADETRARSVMATSRALRFCFLAENDALLLDQDHGFLRTSKTHLLLRFSLPPDFFGADTPLSIEPTRCRELVGQLKPREELLHVQQLADKIAGGWDWLDWQCGSRNELEPLIKALLLLFGGGELVFAPNVRTPKINFRTHLRFHALKKQQRPRALLDALKSSFQAQTNEEIGRLYLAPGKAASGRTIRIEYSQGFVPTQHERLEALLLWRDFLRDKMTLLEIESLLKPAAT